MFRGIYPGSFATAPVATEKFSEAQRDAAKEAAHRAVPRVYQLEGFKGDKLRFLALGCHGSAGDAQAQVGHAMDEFIAKNPGETPDFILLLGDNFYPKGVQSPRSEQFENSFQKPYQALIEKKIPFFVITGNHDYNMRDEAAIAASAQRKLKSFFSFKSKSKSKPKSLPASTAGINQILNEVAYTYLLAAEELYKQNILNLAELPEWNMPARYYALDAGNTRIICMDSSTYIADYLIKDEPGQTIENNQALWLEAVTADAKANNKQCILATHHPIYSPGKRAFKNDLNLYLNKEQRIAIRTEFPAFDEHGTKHRTPYNNYLAACLDAQGLTYDLALAAHDHNLYYYNDGEKKEFVIGGGGGPTQPRAEFAHQHQMGFFAQTHGYGAVQTLLANPENITFSAHRLNKNPLFFSNQNIDAEKNKITDDMVEKLITAVKKAIGQYFDFIASKQNANRPNFILKNSKHGQHEITCVHEIWAMMQEKEMPDYLTLLAKLDQIVKTTKPVFRAEAKHAFSRFLDKALSDEFSPGTTLKNLAQGEKKKYRRSFSLQMS